MISSNGLWTRCWYQWSRHGSAIFYVSTICTLYVTENILATNTINKFLCRKCPLNPFIFICMHYRALVSVACTCVHQRAPCVHLRAFACTCGHLRALAGISVHQRAPRVQSRALSVQWRARDTCVTRTLSRMTSVSTVSRCPAGRRLFQFFNTIL